jgi:hypothetical protein
MITRIIGMEDLSASTVSYDSYKLNAQGNSIINKVLNIKDKDFGGMHWPCLDPIYVSILTT